jgi:serine/threonine protein kinase/Tol biopolymer transport system component
MTPERRSKIERLSHAALALDANERVAFLDGSCTGDAELRRDVESLLAQYASAHFLSEPAGAAVQVITNPGATNPGASMLTGRRIGVYQIQTMLGAGGMGEVYRARDTKLGRDVAIKIMSRASTGGLERLARFEREARMLAALNHPNIGAIYGIEDIDGVPALVLELVDGETIADRIRRGPLPLRDALTIARQITDALEAAHDKGIVHRDLKPANIKITPDGVVKVLDFGLAKVAADEAVAPDPSNSPTVTIGATREGTILGTAAYMSPEQARSQVVDKRTDIWAFGCVLFETLTGQIAFKGDSVSDTIVTILSGEPQWDALPATTPAGVRLVLQRCLEKDAKRRLRDIGDARLEIDQLDNRSSGIDVTSHERALRRAVVTTEPTAGPRNWRSAYVAGALVVVAVLVVAGALLFRVKPSTPVTSPSEYTQLTNFTDSAVAPSLSPDGRMVTFMRGGESFFSLGQIYVKLLPSGDSVRLTNDAGGKYGPVFTPDGSRIAYTNVTGDADWDTWTVPVLGGSPSRLLPNASGLTWITDQRVLFSEIKGGAIHMGIVTATVSRGESREIYFPTPEHGMAHYSYASPDRQSVLVVEMDQTHAFHQPCRLVPFDGSSPGRQVGPRGACTSAAWSPDGRWMYFGARVAGSSHLWRQKFPDGTPEQITFGPSEEEGVALAPDGRSLVTSVGTRRSVIWTHDSTGERAISSEGYALAPRLSKDGTRVFYLVAQDLMLSGAVPGCDCGGWLPSSAELRSVELGSGKSDAVLPGVSITDYDISPDEKEVAFTTTDSNGESTIWLASLDRRTPPRKIADGDEVSFGADGELIFRSLSENNTLVRIRKDETGRSPITTVPVLDKFGVSPDGAWVLVWSPGSGEKAPPGIFAVPTQGGAARKICAECWAMWSTDGRFFYLASQRTSSPSTNATGTTLVIPVPAGKSLPDLPATGISLGTAGIELPGARVIEHDSLSPGPNPSTYLFTKTDQQRNLFRIPLH